MKETINEISENQVSETQRFEASFFSLDDAVDDIVDEAVEARYQIISMEYEENVKILPLSPNYLTTFRIISASGIGLFSILAVSNFNHVIKNPSADNIEQAALIGILSAMGSLSSLIYSLFPDPPRNYK